MELKAVLRALLPAGGETTGSGHCRAYKTNALMNQLMLKCRPHPQIIAFICPLLYGEDEGWANNEIVCNVPGHHPRGAQCMNLALSLSWMLRAAGYRILLFLDHSQSLSRSLLLHTRNITSPISLFYPARWPLK